MLQRPTSRARASVAAQRRLGGGVVHRRLDHALGGKRSIDKMCPARARIIDFGTARENR